MCVFDQVPRVLSDDQTRALGALAREVVVHLELRRAMATLTTSLPEGPSGDPLLQSEVRDELQQATESAAAASALVGEAMERALDAELRMQNLINRVRTIQRRPLPVPRKASD